MRDAQRQKLYDAEQRVRHELDRGARGGTVAALERRWGSVPEVQGYVDSVMYSLGEARIEVVERPTRHRFSSMDRRHHRMNLIMSWGSRETVVLHELAHYVTYAALPSHGPHFAQNFLDLVERFALGEAELAEMLRRAFVKGKVAYGRLAANEMARRELRNVTNGIRGTGTARLIIEAPQDAFQDTWVTTTDLRQGVVAVDRDHLVAVGIHR